MNPNWLVKVLVEYGIGAGLAERMAERIIDSLPMQAMTDAAAGSIEANLPPRATMDPGPFRQRIRPAAANVVQAIALALGEAP